MDNDHETRFQKIRSKLSELIATVILIILAALYMFPFGLYWLCMSLFGK